MYLSVAGANCPKIEANIALVCIYTHIYLYICVYIHISNVSAGIYCCPDLIFGSLDSCVERDKNIVYALHKYL